MNGKPVVMPSQSAQRTCKGLLSYQEHDRAKESGHGMDAPQLLPAGSWKRFAPPLKCGLVWAMESVVVRGASARAH